MSASLILASGSAIRAQLLRNAGLRPEVMAAKVDEVSIRESLTAQGNSPRDIADALAEAKARKIALRHPNSSVIGCDQILDVGGTILAKADTIDAALAQLQQLRGKTHVLHAAAVLYDQAEPVWRHVGQARLTMHDLPDSDLRHYLSIAWPAVQGCLGCYQIEQHGPQLFSRIDGDYFSILGLPLIQLLSALRQRGTMPT